MSSNNYQPRNLLVTGGAGFIGSNFIRYLLSQDKNIKIINLDLLTYAGSLDNLKHLPDEDRYTFIHGNILDAILIEKILREHQIDTIVHFAAESHVDRSINSPSAFVQTNIVGTFTLLEAARQYWTQQQWGITDCRFHHISTDEVYGSLSSQAPAFHEQSPYAPNSPYSSSKAAADHLVRAYSHTYQLPITLSHCSNNYGPQQHPEKFIPTVIRACLLGKPIPIYGDGSHIRDWIYVQDHCEGVLRVIQQGQIGEAYHLGGEHEVSNVVIAQAICEQMDKIYPNKKPHSNLITFVSDRPGHDWRYAMNINKAKMALNWTPKEAFTDGLNQTIAFYK